jgi:excisionase family DNA binding protein
MDKKSSLRSLMHGSLQIFRSGAVLMSPRISSCRAKYGLRVSFPARPGIGVRNTTGRTSRAGFDGVRQEKLGKRPQTWTGLKSPGDSDETRDMPHTLSPALTSNDRRLVFTSSQAAQYLGVSLATIRRWTDAGHISCYRTPGGQRRFSRAQLDEFISSMQHNAPSGESSAQSGRAHVA